MRYVSRLALLVFTTNYFYEHDQIIFFTNVVQNGCQQV